MDKLKLARTIGVSGLCVVAAVCMRSWDGSLPWQLWIPTGLLGGAALLSLQGSTASQLLVRAILWSNLLLAVVVAWMTHGREQAIAAVLGASTGLALLALGKRGLDGDRSSFVPVAFRATLIGLLVMALADAQTLLFWGSLLVSDRGSMERPTGAIALVIAFAFVAGVGGLYRLRAWGLLINTLAAIGLIVAVACGAFHELEPFGWVLAGSAVLQLVLTVPLYLALHRGAARAPALRRTGTWLGALTIVASVVASVVPAALHIVHRWS